MVALVKRLAAKAHKDAGWPGILVGDMSQPRGGPMLTGHASHQVGLDADIWLTPMPNRQIVAQRARGNVGGHDGAPGPARYRSQGVHAGPSRGDPRRRAGADGAAHLRQCRDQEGAVPRGQGRPQLAVTRCGRCTATTIISISASNARPAAGECESQPDPTEGEGCSAGDLAFWFKDSVLHPKPPKVPPKPKPPMTMAQLPAGLQGGADRAGREAIAGVAEPLRRADNAVRLRQRCSGSTVSPRDYRNGASACRIPDTNQRLICARDMCAADTHGAPSMYRLAGIFAAFIILFGAASIRPPPRRTRPSPCSPPPR